VLALDLGQVRIGVALSDPLRVTGQALTTLLHRDLKADLEAIGRLVREHEVTEIVVGHPILLRGERGRAAMAAERFVARLKGHLELPVHLWDERWTTRAAERALGEMRLSRRRRGAVVDRVAAALILQGFLDHERHGRGTPHAALDGDADE
jgi:putative Holliday junction resolvase